jgi:KH domain
LGYIIGKGGSRIKELQSNSGAHVFSQDQDLPNSTEKIMTMIGDSEQLQIASFSLASLIGNEHENPNGPPQVLFDPAFRPPPSYGAAPGSAYGAPVPPPSAYGVPVAPPPGQPALTFQPPLQPLQPEQQQAIAYYYSQMQQMCAQYPEMAPQYQQQYQEYYAQMTSAVPAVPVGPKVVQEISFPNHFVGCVIGKGGSFIRDIKNASGSDVKIADPVEGSDDRTASINGPAEVMVASNR